MRRLPTPRTFVLTSLVLVGNALVLISYFSPWVLLLPAFGNPPGERPYTLWMLLSPDGHANSQILIGILVLIGVVAATSLVFVVLPAIRARSVFGYSAVTFSIVGLAVALLFLLGVPTTLELAAPYYDTRGIEYGAVLGVAGLACVAVGVLGILGAWNIGQSSPTSAP